MTSDCPQVRNLLAVLAPKILSCQEILNAQAISHAMIGLQYMSSCHKEVESIRRSLSDLIERGEGDTRQPKKIISQYTNMNEISSDFPKKRKIMSDLLHAVQNSLLKPWVLLHSFNKNPEGGAIDRVPP